MALQIQYATDRNFAKLNSNRKKTYRYKSTLKRFLTYSTDRNFAKLNSNRKKTYRYKSTLKHLSTCGRIIKVEIHCKQCEQEQKKDVIIDKIFIKQTCGIRYCNHLHCQLTRYARIFESLKKINRLKNLRKLWHFVIGFEPIDIIYFKEKRKEFDKIIALYFNRINEQLKKLGITKIQAFKFLDFAKEQNNKYFMHYHFLAIPFKSESQRDIMQIFQDERKKLLNKIPFHTQFFGNKSKLNLFSYMAKRCTGLYRPIETPQDYVRGKIGKFKQQILNNEYMRLSDFMLFDDFYNLFYKRRLYSTIGGLPYGSILVCNDMMPEGFRCALHGVLQRNQIKMRFIQPPPPEMAQEPLKITSEHLDSYICESCGIEFSEKDIRLHTIFLETFKGFIRDPEKKLCPYCYYKGTAEYRFEQKQIAFENYLESKSLNKQSS